MLGGDRMKRIRKQSKKMSVVSCKVITGEEITISPKVNKN